MSAARNFRAQNGLKNTRINARKTSGKCPVSARSARRHAFDCTNVTFGLFPTARIGPGPDRYVLPDLSDQPIPTRMNPSIETIQEKIRGLELELEAEFAKRRTGLRYGLERGRVRFEEEVKRRHRQLRTHLARYVFTARPIVWLTAPVIYSLIVPFAIVDLWVSIYQAICFRVYGIPQVQRHRYFLFDRSGLAYLNMIEKLNCAYCSYVNGVIAYVREVGSRTEQYWCPIKQARRVIGAHARYAGFEEYGDGEHYHDRLKAQQAEVRTTQDPAVPLEDG